jgi:hypothetical protein
MSVTAGTLLYATVLSSGRRSVIVAPVQERAEAWKHEPFRISAIAPASGAERGTRHPQCHSADVRYDA